jgi:glycosyltransferase involved in cell wall biosynthesis
MKLLFIITGLDYGGAEKMLLTNCTYLSAQGYTIKVVTLIKPQALVKDFNDLGIEVDVLNIKGYKDLFGALIKYKKIIKQFRPDLIHAHMVHANLFSRIAAIFFGKKAPLVNTTHDPNFKKNRYRNFLYRITNWRVDYITAISYESYKNYCEYTKVDPEKICYMDNLVDTGHFKRNSLERTQLRKDLKIDNQFVWTAIGSFYEQKDYPNLLNAFSILLKDYPDTVLLILGRGPLENEIVNIIKKLELEKKVQLLGVRDNVAGILNASDAFVMSSAWEGQSIALLEAAASGLPIVATDVGGNSTVVKEKNGFLVKPGNHYELYKGMSKIMKMDYNRLNEMGNQSRLVVVENYSVNRMVKKIVNLYSTLLKSV